MAAELMTGNDDEWAHELKESPKNKKRTFQVKKLTQFGQK